jgi:hypothetical protein
VFEIMALKGELTAAQLELRGRFAEGLAAYQARCWAAGDRSERRQSIAVAFKRLSQSLHFKTGAEQREQAADQDHSAPGRQEDVGFPAELWEMPENDNGE